MRVVALTGQRLISGIIGSWLFGLIR